MSDRIFKHERGFDSLFGIPVITDSAIPEKQPKFYLKRGSYVSEGVRRDFNDFLIQNFGYEPGAIITPYAIYIHPKNIQFIERLMAKNQDKTGGSVDSLDLIPWKDCRNNAPVYPLFPHLGGIA